METKTVPFDIYIPASEHREAIKVTTIDIEVLTDEHGQEMITPESSERIDKTQARYMGLLAGADITMLRKKLGLTQDQLSEQLGCGKKSLSRWENGREFPTQLVNTLLRLLEDERIDLSDLKATRQPRIEASDKIVQFVHKRKNAPKTYHLPSSSPKSLSAPEKRIPA
jgi:putative zinc finger/helix-turn-helix YgiT family protein